MNLLRSKPWMFTFSKLAKCYLVDHLPEQVIVLRCNVRGIRRTRHRIPNRFFSSFIDNVCGVKNNHVKSFNLHFDIKNVFINMLNGCHLNFCVKFLVIDILILWHWNVNSHFIYAYLSTNNHCSLHKFAH